jgi:hypothetical protein
MVCKSVFDSKMSKCRLRGGKSKASVSKKRKVREVHEEVREEVREGVNQAGRSEVQAGIPEAYDRDKFHDVSPQAAKHVHVYGENLVTLTPRLAKQPPFRSRKSGTTSGFLSSLDNDAGSWGEY